MSPFGGDDRVRTDGLLRARQALSHLSYTPRLLVRLASLFESALPPLQNYIVLSFKFLPAVLPTTSLF